MSYYQIAGIHGAPYIPWEGVDRCPQCAITGYCCHASTLFPTWHRLYVVLFEQALQIHALIIAQQFQGEDQQRYTAIAMELRMAYWDWAAPMKPGENAIPTLFTDPTVNVTTPNGPQIIPNPLQKFTFPAGADNSFTVDPASGTTVRRSTLTVEGRKQLRADTWTLLTSQHVYEAFSTEALSGGSGENPNSLEALHDQIHILVGGDMGYVPSAAFDPIFFFHHCNVDRLLAIWQTLYPASWLEPWKEVGQTYTYTSGTIQNSSSPLTPFRSNSSIGFWDTNSCRSTESVNYEYPEIASGDRASAINVINTLYRDTPTNSNTKRVNDGAIAAYGSSGQVQEYVANVRVDSTGTAGSFTLFLFCGDFDDSDPDNWHNEANLAGYHGFFTGPDAQGDGTALVNAGISITDFLLQAVARGSCSDMSSASVTEYLRENMQWRTRSVNGTVLPPEAVPALEVAVMACPVDLPGSESDMPNWGQWDFLTECTQNKPNGYSGGGLQGFLNFLQPVPGLQLSDITESLGLSMA
ncbi:Di-copper centre-containing protein [Teratosphaeria destructans]|uniref:tyrosinase n=1 Tax=Teratosphaeria destructans TaxID=418781 RepID=A0A9W7SSJ9_9PEZI|nr:Di-copper centre-containing protein [Teratosphaeria destructans]